METIATQITQTIIVVILASLQSDKTSKAPIATRLWGLNKGIGPSWLAYPQLSIRILPNTPHPIHQMLAN